MLFQDIHMQMENVFLSPVSFFVHFPSLFIVYLCLSVNVLNCLFFLGWSRRISLLLRSIVNAALWKLIKKTFAKQHFQLTI